VGEIRSVIKMSLWDREYCATG